jgi:HD superfamily phosphohydrolase
MDYSIIQGHLFSALFHDIWHTAFSHTYDFAKDPTKSYHESPEHQSRMMGYIEHHVGEMCKKALGEGWKKWLAEPSMIVKGKPCGTDRLSYITLDAHHASVDGGPLSSHLQVESTGSTAVLALMQCATLVEVDGKPQLAFRMTDKKTEELVTQLSLTGQLVDRHLYNSFEERGQNTIGGESIKLAIQQALVHEADLMLGETPDDVLWEKVRACGHPMEKAIEEKGHLNTVKGTLVAPEAKSRVRPMLLRVVDGASNRIASGKGVSPEESVTQLAIYFV